MNLSTSKKRSEEFKKISDKKFYRKLLSNNPTIIDILANKAKLFIYSIEFSQNQKFMILKIIRNLNF